MHVRLANWEWACAYCRLPPLEGDQVWFVSESNEHCTGPWTVVTDREDCPKERCPFCQKAPIAYSFHLQCLGTIHQFLHDQKVLEDKRWRLRCAQAMALIPILQDERTPTPRSLVKALYLLFQKITSILAPHAPLEPLFQRLYKKLPPELQELVFSFMLESPGGHTLFNQEALYVLEALRSWPEEMHRRISCDGALFARWNTVGSMSYLAGIYEERVRDSIQMKAEKDWNRLVIYWNNLRVISIALVSSNSALADAGGPEYVQILPRPAHKNLWVTMQGLFVSRIDSSKEYHQRILWNSPTPLPYHAIPEEPRFCMLRDDRDVDATCLILEGVTGISVAHYNGEIVSIHLHKEDHHSSSIYEQVHEWATWMYCPIDKRETVTGAWLIRHSGTGTGFIVKTAYKYVWLCPYSDPDSLKTFQLLALAETRAIYHSSCMRHFGSIPACSIGPQRVGPCSFPELPSILRGNHQYQWSFSAASLENARAVRMSRGGGVEVRYNNFSRCLGDFRPSEALGWLENPAYFKVSYMSETRHAITFFDEGNEEVGVLSLSRKYIVFWTCRNDSIIEVKDSI